MIIQVAGTSGSGKSHLVRAFMRWAEKEEIPVETQYVSDLTKPQGRGERPVGYVVGAEGRGIEHNVFLPGAYETPTGGCDTIRNLDTAFGLIESYRKQGCHVLYEGLFMMNQQRGPALAAELGKNFCVLQLTTPLAICMASINARRAERGAEELVNKKNTIDNYKRAENYCSRMRNAGARVFRVSRDEGLDKILELLGAE